MQDELHASGFVEEAFENELLAGGNDPQAVVYRDEVIRQLASARITETSCLYEPSAQIFLRLGRVAIERFFDRVLRLGTEAGNRL